MAGKGDKIRKGANLGKYWENFPFSEKNTVTYWTNKLGYDVIDESVFSDIPAGKRITEEEYISRIERMNTAKQTLCEEDLEELSESMNSMSFSEFQKFLK